MKYPRLSLAEFMDIYHKVPRAAVDVIIRTAQGILLTKRAIPPFKGMWHIPRGTILFMEPVRHAIDRIVLDELGVKVRVLQHLGIIEYFEDDGRHTVSNAYLAEIKAGKPRGSNQGTSIAFFQKPPQNCIPLQKKFLENYLATSTV